MYQLTCSLSGKYIGETRAGTSESQPGRYDSDDIMNTYVTQKKRRRDPPWGEHFLVEHHASQSVYKSITAKILQGRRTGRDREVAESLHIRTNRLALNNSIASWAITWGAIQSCDHTFWKVDSVSHGPEANDLIPLLSDPPDIVLQTTGGTAPYRHGMCSKAVNMLYLVRTFFTSPRIFF